MQPQMFLGNAVKTAVVKSKTNSRPGLSEIERRQIPTGVEAMSEFRLKPTNPFLGQSFTSSSAGFINALCQ